MNRLKHILNLIDDVHRYVSPETGREPYENNELVRTWARHKLILIGEAAAQLSDEIRGRYPDIPFRLMSDIRNRLNHGYDQIDDEIVWDTIVQDLPELREQVEAAVREEGE